MAYAELDGIRIHYEVYGSGPPLLMLAPGGFESSIEQWRSNHAWKNVQPLETLAGDFTLIAYDRREVGQSGGRVEPLTWDLYADNAVALLDHLRIESAFLLGGCMGCAVSLAVAARFPQRCRALLLHWPVGGFRWMHKGISAFDKHVAFVREHGLAASAEFARHMKRTFWHGEQEGGPWWRLNQADPAFARDFARQDAEAYCRIVEESRDRLFSDTLPSGAGGEQLMAIDVPAHIMSGDDAAHSCSSAHALRELMPRASLSPLMPQQQDADAVRQWVRQSARA